MYRVATYGHYQSALLNLMTAQQSGADAQERVSTKKNATDLVGFGRTSEVLTSLKGSQSRLQGFLDTAEAANARLVFQDLAMNQVDEGITGISEAVNNALSVDNAVTLMLDLENSFQQIRGGLNTKHQGNYLFSGATTDTTPVTANNLTDLAALPTAADAFHNDTLKSVSRVAEGTSLQTGVLADELGTDIVGILRDIQTFNAGPSGPLTGKLTDAQKTFLTAQVQRLKDASVGVVNKIAQTGAMANQIESLIDSQEGQQLQLDEMVGKKTDADMAKALMDLQLSGVAIEASAQVISSLRDASLLNFLR
jgi:flagellar hook-associated protein 3 FlgL